MENGLFPRRQCPRVDGLAACPASLACAVVGGNRRGRGEVESGDQATMNPVSFASGSVGQILNAQALSACVEETGPGQQYRNTRRDRCVNEVRHRLCKTLSPIPHGLIVASEPYPWPCRAWRPPPG